MARRRNCRELGVHVEPFWMSDDLPGCGESLPEQMSMVAPMISGKADMLRVPDILTQPRSSIWLSRSGYFRASPPPPPPPPYPKTGVLLRDREEGNLFLIFAEDAIDRPLGWCLAWSVQYSTTGPQGLVGWSAAPQDVLSGRPTHE